MNYFEALKLSSCSVVQFRQGKLLLECLCSFWCVFEINDDGVFVSVKCASFLRWILFVRSHREDYVDLYALVVFASVFSNLKDTLQQFVQKTTFWSRKSLIFCICLVSEYKWFDRTMLFVWHTILLISINEGVCLRDAIFQCKAVVSRNHCWKELRNTCFNVLVMASCWRSEATDIVVNGFSFFCWSCCWHNL